MQVRVNEFHCVDNLCFVLTIIVADFLEVLAAPELKGVKMNEKKTPKSGSPAVFWVLFGSSIGALEPNTSTITDQYHVAQEWPTIKQLVVNDTNAAKTGSIVQLVGPVPPGLPPFEKPWEHIPETVTVKELIPGGCL